MSFFIFPTHGIEKKKKKLTSEFKIKLNIKKFITAGEA